MSPTAFLRRNWPHIKKARVADRQDGRRRPPRRPTQHARCRLVWHGCLVERASICRLRPPANGREMGDAAFAANGDHRRGRKKENRQISCLTANISSRPTRSIPTPSTPGTAAKSTRFRPKLGVPGRLAASVAEKGNLTALQALWRYNFSPGCRSLSRSEQARPLVCDAGEAGL